MHIWHYYKKKYYDKRGRRWHFMTHNVMLESDQQFDLYFRDDDRTVFGVVRYGPKDAFAGLETVTRKLMHDTAYRARFLDDESKAVWKGR